MTLARRLADFTAALEFDALPSEVVASAKLRTLDILGIALAATTLETAPSILGALEGWGGGGDCTVLGTKQTATVPLAILANGSLAHSLDYDDTHAASITHASAVVVPVALALGEAGGLDGRTVITAAVAGYESIARLGMAASGVFHARGWHATAVCGAFAAALVAGRLERLDPARLTAALGIAGSFASGVLEHLEDGSWVKRVHPGWAGHAGAVASALARGGFTGPATVLDGRFGFYRNFVGAEPDQAPFETLCRQWETLAIGYKPYPCCHYNHAYLDCALELRREHCLTAEAIEAVECLVPAGQVPIVCEPRAAKLRPRTAYDAQFSLPFSVASALLDGRVGLDTYAPERLTEAARLGLAARVRHTVDPDSAFPRGFPGWVRLRLRDGRTLEARAPDGRGSLSRPLPAEAIVEKFRDNASRAVAPARVAEIERTVLGLDAVADVRSLTTLCRA
ncbi:MAG TPA: MmgE/PrpD family protein [Methylomirabilota bacterium]|nr:MmgE/PrpD family protein [Methylomirabilota bacterium]